MPTVGAHAKFIVRPSTRLLQFNLRTLLVVFTVAIIWLGLQVSKGRDRQRVIQQLERSRASVENCHKAVAVPIGKKVIKYPPQAIGGGWLRHLMGEQCFLKVRAVGGLSPDDQLMEDLTHLPELEILIINGGRLTDRGLRHVGHLPQLKLLVVKHGRRVSNAGLSSLDRLTNLRELDLEGLAVDNEVLVHIEKLTQLERFCVKQTLMTEEGIDDLRNILPNTEVEFHPRVKSPSLFP